MNSVCVGTCCDGGTHNQLMEYEPVLVTGEEIRRAVWSESQNMNRNKFGKNKTSPIKEHGRWIKHLISTGSLLSNMLATATCSNAAQNAAHSNCGLSVKCIPTFKDLIQDRSVNYLFNTF